MHEFNPFAIISKAYFAGAASIKMWLLIFAIAVIGMWSHQQWTKSSRMMSGKKLIFWVIVLLGLYYLSGYLDKMGYYDRWLIQLGWM